MATGNSIQIREAFTSPVVNLFVAVFAVLLLLFLTPLSLVLLNAAFSIPPTSQKVYRKKCPPLASRNKS
jgi:hypothetical protein